MKSTLRGIGATIMGSSPGKALDAHIESARRLVDQACAKGLTERDQARLRQALASLEQKAEGRIRSNVTDPAALRSVRRNNPQSEALAQQFSKTTAERNSKVVVEALNRETHWRSKEYREHLQNLVRKNESIPATYKEHFHRDVANVLQACPHAGGLVNELTARGQRGTTGSRSKIGAKGNLGVGSVYELIGTSALTQSISKPANQEAPPLRISSGKDIVTFGDKANINREMSDQGNSVLRPTRRTVECDLRIGRASTDGYREIGVDFKHTKESGTRYGSKDLKNQVENVAKAIRHGQLHEYHFVTNGKFGPSFRDTIATVNAELKKDGHSPIGYHEGVTSGSGDSAVNHGVTE